MRGRPRHLRWLVTCLLATAACAWSQDGVDSDAILRALARPAPAATDFLEVRDSPMLKAPLRLAGEYRRPDAGTLVREVRTPYAETTTLRAGEATIERAGKPSRTFSLSRAPELAALQSSFGALLAGDTGALHEHYRVEAGGTRERWVLQLSPRDATLAARLHGITLHGRGDELRCIESTPAKGEVQRTLMGAAARAVTDGADIAALCRGAGG
ncbi:MAG: fatty acyl CoA synthetase [Luteimonas sp.]|nr:fatty acyl CoA synthetase [Luteimonas sp.]